MTYEKLWDEDRLKWDKEHRLRRDKEPDVEICGEMGTCMRDGVCSTLPVMVYQKQKAGHSEAVLSENGFHAKQVQG